MRMSSRSTIPDLKIERNRGRGRFGFMQYPSAGSTHGVYMNFTEYKYGGGRISAITPKGSIALPLPENITDSLGVNVAGREIGVGGAGVANVIATEGGALGSAMDSVGNIGETFGEGVKDRNSTGILSTASTYASFLAKAGLSSIGAGFGDSISAATGTAINPHATLVFDGVNLKSFTFNWKLAPSNAAESREIHEIIRTIKSKILPKYGDTETLSRGILTYPNMVDIGFVGFDKDKIFRFKRSMVSSFEVDYSPNGNVMIKGDTNSAPAFVNLAMSFTESQIWTADDEF